MPDTELDIIQKWINWLCRCCIWYTLFTRKFDTLHLLLFNTNSKSWKWTAQI